MNNNTLLTGPGFFVQGLRTIFDSTLRWFVLWPILINSVVFIGLAYWAISWFYEWQSAIVAGLPSWLSFLEYLLIPLFAIGVALMFFFMFTVVGNFIAAPFNAILSEKIQLREGVELPGMQLKDWFAILPKSMAREFRKLCYYLPRAIVLLALSFIPVINLAIPVLWFLFNGWMMALQYCDYAADNRQVPFKTMVACLKAHNPQSWTMGATISLVMSIPFVNLVIMPAAVAGATLFWEGRIEATRTTEGE